MEPKTESNENLKQKPMSPEETATVGVVRESDSLKWEGFVIRVDTRHGTGSLGHRVNGSFGSSFTSGSPGRHFDPVGDPSSSGFPLQTFVTQLRDKYSLAWDDANLAFWRRI